MGIGIDRDMVKAGLVQPKVIENGVVVEPVLQINTHTMQEHNSHLMLKRLPRLTEAESKRLYPPPSLTMNQDHYEYVKPREFDPL